MNTQMFCAKKETLGSVPLSFNVFTKRIITFIPCNDAHFVAYFVVNAGAWITKEDQKLDANSFIVDTDSMYGGPTKSLYLFLHFILEVVKQLEVWVASY